jgi:Disaggregatase related repeat
MKKVIFIFTSLVISATFLTSCEQECTCPQPEEKTLTTQPGPDNGQDCIVCYRDGDGGVNAAGNHNFNPDFIASHWTHAANGWGQGSNRSYIKFPELSQIPQNATIKSAKLSLYGLTAGIAAPQGNSTYPGSPYASYGTNEAWLKRVTGNWDEATITWNNKPAATDVNQVWVPASNAQWNYNVVDLDVTQLVKDMISNNQNYGFVLQLHTEQIYRSVAFASSEVADAGKRPKLVVVYEVD